MVNLRIQLIVVLSIFILTLSVGCGGDDKNPVGSGPLVKTVYLDYRVNLLDLDTGVIDTIGYWDPKDPIFDVYALRSEDAIIWNTIGVNVGRTVASIDSVTFSEVTIADAVFANFETYINDRGFDSSSVVLVRTNDGQLYKFGNPIKISTGMTFDYQLMLEGPDAP